MTSHEFHGRHVLITGGLGFVGSNLTQRLVDLGAHVILVDSLIPEYGGNLFNIAGIQDRVQVNISDVRDVHGMRYLIQGQDYLFNLAGQTSHMDSMQDPYTDLEINCRSHFRLLQYQYHQSSLLYRIADELNDFLEKFPRLSRLTWRLWRLLLFSWKTWKRISSRLRRRR